MYNLCCWNIDPIERRAVVVITVLSSVLPPITKCCHCSVKCVVSVSVSSGVTLLWDTLETQQSTHTMLPGFTALKFIINSVTWNL